MDQTRQPGIQIAQILLERASFTHREDALSLEPNTPFQPELALDVQGGAAPDEKTAFVRITVQTKPEDKPLYNFTVSMVALLQVTKGQENFSLKEYVQAGAPVMLYPFVREAVASLTWRGRFGPVWLAPLNVAAILSAPSEPEALPKIQRPSRERPKKRSKTRTR